ncbi:unnamed protein product [Clavelina lepadiformis]|uniref:CUB domain-containing protein n=1 Tax=Clavelina lepadiformis TaxID=159417 RepID=A0ABP0GW91_CLALP
MKLVKWILVAIILTHYLATCYERNGSALFKKTCLQHNSTLDEEYKTCIRSVHDKHFMNLRCIDFDSILGFVEDHWTCDSLIPVSCSPKGGTCYPQKWLRRIPDMVSAGTPLFWSVYDCNNEIFPRPTNENCHHWLPTYGTAETVSTSPGYPDQINHEFDCLYDLQGQANFGLKVKVEVDTESCCDFVTLYRQDRSLLAKLSGNVTRTFEVDYNMGHIFVQYHTDESVASRGFRITRNNVCMYQHMSNDGVMIHAPTYPYPFKPILETFGEEMNCQWLIRASPGGQVYLILHIIKLNICCEQLEIIDGHVSLGNYTIARASEIPLMSRHGSLTIKYKSDSTVSGNGFRASYGTVYHSCGGDYNATVHWQNVTVEQVRDNLQYLERCISRLWSSPGYVITLNISSTSNHKPSDWVEIYDGPTLIQKFTNDTYKYMSSGNRLAISYRPRSTVWSGYQASFKQVLRNEAEMFSSRGQW